MKRLLPFVVLLAGCSTGAYRMASVSGPSYAGGGPAPLRAGEVDDNDRLPEYLAYVAAYPHGDVPKIDLTDRRILQFTDSGGFSLWDAPVTVVAGGRPIYAGRTTGAGELLVPLRALGVPPDAPLSAVVGGAGEVPISPWDDAVRVGLPPPGPSRVDLDVALVIDTTSSMADEIDALRASLRDVVARIERLGFVGRLRIGGVAYRDVGDAYVTWPFDFTERIDAVEGTIASLGAAGGGDLPEAVHEALDVAVNRLTWSPRDAVRLLFLVGDAGPHLERGVPYTVTMRRAVEKGIEIVPVGCSGLDDTGEFVFRQLAAFTLGTFVFLSYGGTTEHHTGPYVENDLDDVLVHAVDAAVRATKTRGDPSRPRAGVPPACAAPPPTWAPNPQGVPPPVVAWPAPAPRPGPRIGYGRAPDDFAAWGWPR